MIILSILKTSCSSCLIHPRDFNTRIVGFKYLLRRPALFREPVGADLAHPNTVAPSSSDERELRYTCIIIIFAVDDEELFTLSER
jgi:hypothetical protein